MDKCSAAHCKRERTPDTKLCEHHRQQACKKSKTWYDKNRERRLKTIREAYQRKRVDST